MFLPRTRTYEELINGNECDVLFCQPPLLKRIPYDQQEKAVIDYFGRHPARHNLLGDSPYEQNNGILQLAANLRTAGLRVEYLDFHGIDQWGRNNRRGTPLSDGEIHEILSRFKYSVLAISVMTISAPLSLFIARISKQINPQAAVIAGGLFPAAMPDYYRNCGVVVADGEAPQSHILSLFSKSNSSGRAYRAYDLVAQDVPLIPRITTSSGCPGQCAFCSPQRAASSGAKSPLQNGQLKAVVEELHELVDVYDVDFFVLGNLSFLSDLRRDGELLDLLGNDEKIPPYWCQVRLDSLDRTLIGRLAESKCRQVAIGMESASMRVLKRHNKEYKVKADARACMEEMLCCLKEHNISTYAYFMLGIPGETEAEVLNTVALIESLIEGHLLDAAHISIPVPYPGTPWYASPEKYGFSLRHRDYGEYWMNSDPLGYGMPVFDTPELPAERLYELWLETLACISHKLTPLA